MALDLDFRYRSVQEWTHHKKVEGGRRGGACFWQYADFRGDLRGEAGTGTLYLWNTVCTEIILHAGLCRGTDKTLLLEQDRTGLHKRIHL